jgi:hypothetical protein
LLKPCGGVGAAITAGARMAPPAALYWRLRAGPLALLLAPSWEWISVASVLPTEMPNYLTRGPERAH